SGKFKHRDTVAVDTPAISATSSNVGVGRLMGMVSLVLILLSLTALLARAQSKPN
ncbi:MAG: hypothetical protein ACI9HB_003480, partial [Gammaproteobacteria bacterium]